MAVESGGNPQANSSAGAIGLMQVMPGWFHSGEKPWNPDTNINKGTQILRRCKDRAGGRYPGDDWSRALTCYHTGSVNGSAPGYVSKVQAAWHDLVAQGA
jgi:soluble lytic murein transglycosylase-like protein